jgi:lipopolysaccharide biosynthesis glycosyltransferase
MNIVLCGDRCVLPGIHVATYSLLSRMNPAVQEVQFNIFTDGINEVDIALLRQTLNFAARPYTLNLHHLDKSSFSGYPTLNGSLGPYYRLYAAQVMPVERFLYVDADTLCDVDVSALQTVEMGCFPAAWVPEAPLSKAVDRSVAEQLVGTPTEFYFNSGVLLVNVAEWRRQKITERALDYIATNRPAFYDQSALNFILHRNALILDCKYNCVSNMRKNWRKLSGSFGQIGQLVHFLDYPKPWDFLSEWLHPQYQLWRAVLNRTALKSFRSWHSTATRRFPRTRTAWVGYKKAIKDRILFSGYSRGWLKRVKGASDVNHESAPIETLVKA